MTKDVLAAMKGEGTLVAAISHGKQCFQLLNYSDGSWEITNATRTIGLWEAEHREICIETFRSLATRMNKSGTALWVRSDWGILNQFAQMNLRLGNTSTVLPFNQGCKMRHANDDQNSRLPKTELSSSAAPPSEALQPFRILIVEDQPDSARLLKRLLERFGYHVATAGSGERAIEIASEEIFDLIISDIGLPDCSGYELMQTLRNRFGLTGLALTGFSGKNDSIRSSECGFVEHLVKPVDISNLYAAVERAHNAKKRAAIVRPSACTN